MTVAEVVCLGWGSLHRTPVKVVLMRRADSKRLYDWALVSTDVAATGESIIARYASRWSVEMVFPQMTKTRMRTLRAGRQHVADLHLPVGDDHPVDEQLHQHPALREVGPGQPGADRGAKAFDALGEGTKLHLLAGKRLQLLLLGEQGGPAAVQLSPGVLHFGQGDHLGQVGLQQPLTLTVQLL